MSYFGKDTFAENVLNDVLSWQRSHEISDTVVVYNLLRIAKYFAEDAVNEENKSNALQN